MSDVSRAASVRRNLGIGALVVGPPVITAGTLIQVDTGNAGIEEIRKVAAHPNRFYASGVLFGIGLALLAAGIGQLYRLAERRGAVWTTVGGLLMQVGAALAAAAILVWTLAVHVAADDRLPRTVMGEWDHIAGNSVGAGWPWSGFVALSVGGLVLGVGLLRARTVPIWQPVLVMVGVVLVFFLQPSNGVASAAVGLPLVVGLISLAWSVSPLRRPVAEGPIDLTTPEMPFPRTTDETVTTDQPTTT